MTEKDTHKKLLYLIPYFVIIALGAWHRIQLPNIPFLNDDSCNYLIPPFIKQLLGEWHKGERPMPYLELIYLTLTDNFGLKNTIAFQKILGMLGAVFLTGAWIVYVNKLKIHPLLWHLAGYFMVAVYVNTPVLLYYEQMIGPELFSIFIMCVLIFLLTIALTNPINNKVTAIAISAAIFVNLYLPAPMPKWVFAQLIVEALLVYWVIKRLPYPRKAKIYLLMVPHLLYLFFVPLQEYMHKADSEAQDRVYIEFEQMAYTHFDLLAQDKSNFNVAPALQDSLVLFLKEAQQRQPDFLIGFNNDDLMWGKASSAINHYYKNNFDSIGHFYKHLNWVLVTKYPFALAGQIGKQIGAFYIPNRYISKQLYLYPTIPTLFQNSLAAAKEFDTRFTNNNGIRSKYVEMVFLNRCRASIVDKSLRSKFDQLGVEAALKANVINHDTVAKIWQEAQATPFPVSPLINLYTPEREKEMAKDYTVGYWEYKLYFLTYTFDYIFLLAMVLFFAIRTYQRQLGKIHLVNLLYLLIAVYVATLAIVHTFDVVRFIDTIYPFLLVTTFMAGAYIVDFFLTIILQRIANGKSTSDII